MEKSADLTRQQSSSDGSQNWYEFVPPLKEEVREAEDVLKF